MSDLLKNFYREYFLWLEEGAPENVPFSRKQGLCGAISTLYTDLETHDWIDLKDEMRQQFKGADLHSVYPFGSYILFDSESQHSAMHLNEARIKWVKDHHK